MILKAYKMILLLSTLSKVVEKYITIAISNRVEAGQLLYEGQYGFRLYRFTMDVLVILVDMVDVAWRSEKQAALMLIDIKNLFPYVSRNRLVSKMKKTGIIKDKFIV